jgi:hypothetical protein
MPEHRDRYDTKPKIMAAAITGAVAGAVRALTTWLLDHLTTNS